MLTAISRQLLRSFVSHRLRERYRGAALGIFWALLRPVFTMAILALVAVFFALETPFNVPNTAFILVGLIPWLFTTASIGQSCIVLVQESNVIKKVFFPRPLLPLAVTLAEWVHFVIAYAVLMPIVYITLRFLPDEYILLLPVVIVLHAVLIYAISLIVALANVYFRDVSAIIDTFLMAWFYFSPVFYSITYVKSAVDVGGVHPAAMWVYLLNPMTSILYVYRLALLHGAGTREGVALPLSTLELSGALCWSAFVALALLGIAHLLYRHHDNRIADYL